MLSVFPGQSENSRANLGRDPWRLISPARAHILTTILALTDILALDEAILNGPRETFASLLFVTIVRGTIEETVAFLDRVVDGL